MSRRVITSKPGIKNISKFPDSEYSEEKSLLFRFKNNSLTERVRESVLISEIFEVLCPPDDKPTLYEISDVRDYKYACPRGEWIYLAPFPTIWEENTAFRHLAFRLSAKHRQNNFLTEFKLGRWLNNEI